MPADRRDPEQARDPVFGPIRVLDDARAARHASNSCTTPFQGAQRLQRASLARRARLVCCAPSALRRGPVPPPSALRRPHAAADPDVVVDVDAANIPARLWEVPAWDTTIRYSANGAQTYQPRLKAWGNGLPFPSANGAKHTSPG